MKKDAPLLLALSDQQDSSSRSWSMKRDAPFLLVLLALALIGAVGVLQIEDVAQLLVRPLLIVALVAVFVAGSILVLKK